MVGQLLARKVVGRHDDPFRVDQVADPSGQPVLVVVLAGLAFCVVGLTDGAFGVGDQTEREAFGVGKGLLFFDGVEGRTDDGAVGGIEFWGSVTEPSTFTRSTGCGRFRVPPERHPLAPKILERDGGPVLIGCGEVRRVRSNVEHACTIPPQHPCPRTRPAAQTPTARSSPVGAWHLTPRWVPGT